MTFVSSAENSSSNQRTPSPDFPDSTIDRLQAREVYAALSSEDRIAAAVWLVRAIAWPLQPEKNDIRIETLGDILDVDPFGDLDYLGKYDPLSMLELSELVTTSQRVRTNVAVLAPAFSAALEAYASGPDQPAEYGTDH